MVAAMTATATNIGLLFMRLLFQLHRNCGRGTDAQWMFGICLGKFDTNRYALGDLYPIARCILRREQGESCTGAAAHAFYRAYEVLTRVHIDLDINILTGMNANQLGFFKVGVDMKTIVSDKREKRHTNANQ
jgi:hypothetical protein